MKTTQTTAERSDDHLGLTQRAAWLMAANVIAMILGILPPFVLVRMMSQAEFGLYKQAFLILLTMLGLLNLQVAVSVFYFMAREPEKKLQVALNVLIFYVFSGAVVATLFYLWPQCLTLIFRSGDLVPYLPLLGLAILATLVANNLEAIPIASGDVRIASALIVAAQLIRSSLMVIAVLMFGTLRAILTAMILQGALQIVIMLGYLRRRYQRIWAPFDWQLFKAQVGNALPFGIGGVAAVLQEDLHNYFISYHYDSASFAIYSVGCFQLPLLAMLVTSFAGALNPEVARQEREGNNEGIYSAWVHVIRNLAFVLIPTYALLMVMRREFITGLFTANYAASIPIFAVNLLIVVLTISMHYPILRVFDDLRYFRFKFYVVLLPVTFVALYVGWRTAGLVGVATAVVLTRVLDVLVIVSVVSRRLQLGMRHLASLAPLLRTAGAALIAAAAISFLRFGLNVAEWVARLAAEIANLVKLRFAAAEWHALLVLGICSIVFVPVYLVSAWGLGAFTDAEKAALNRIWAKLKLKSGQWSVVGSR